MPFVYTIAKDGLKLGDYDQKYGQAWWVEVNEHLQPVKFNVMTQDSFVAGDKITCEERTERQSTKGTAYFQLKKVSKLVSGSQTQVEDVEASTAPQNSSPSVSVVGEVGTKQQLDRIEAKLDKLLGNDAALTGQDTVHPVTDAPVNLDDLQY